MHNDRAGPNGTVNQSFDRLNVNDDNDGTTRSTGMDIVLAAGAREG